MILESEKIASRFYIDNTKHGTASESVFTLCNPSITRPSTCTVSNTNSANQQSTLSPIKMSPPSHYQENSINANNKTTLQHSTVTTNLHGSFPYQTIHHSSKNIADTIITCCCFNSRSFVSKLSTFQSFVFSTGYNLICVTETWLSDHIFDHEIIPSQYSIYRNDRTTRGGGVMIAIQDIIPATLFSPPDHLEIITVRLELQNPVLLCCIYISPSPDRTILNDVISFLTFTLFESNPRHCFSWGF